MTFIGPNLALASHAALRLRHQASAEVVKQIADNLDMPDPLTAKRTEKITTHQEAAFVEQASRALRDIDFGFSCGLTYATAGTLPAYLAEHASTLREGLNLAIDHLHTVRPGMDFVLDESGNAANLRLVLSDTKLLEFPRHTEMIYAGVTAQVRAFTKRAFYPDAISFSYHRPPIGAEVRARMGCAVAFGAEQIEMSMSPAILDACMVSSDEVLLGLLLDQAKAIEAKVSHAQASTAEKVEVLIEAGLAHEVPKISDIAHALGLSQRTLARRLNEAETSYSGILNHVRLRVAARELRESKNQIGEISWRLGYGSTASFSTAFKRETGLSPREYRQMNT
ncbi:AraC family transcriptional regulator [Roseobacter denitrificans]|uniref:Transcriptional regulator, AraC family, putative n=1 Tax=Roseobacter denitrificans (strain ATCC 33942 / OCh 114) TaxID=375451 RepID=Q169B6_ROSDO|nr:AraC family transcriptional regulator [Roseobacter denitrificans]ABG31427.1 transcriptional regulator, AraC family, putative [Roseobacter denitrificans OCh 114]AVL54440.1 AraC family transcriptional regulator [Roseobacter denitrificans]SFG01153.1 transcriptional regulator, AraC family [Roseobacter denitrificans OCh 114]